MSKHNVALPVECACACQSGLFRIFPLSFNTLCGFYADRCLQYNRDVAAEHIHTLLMKGRATSFFTKIHSLECVLHNKMY